MEWGRSSLWPGSPSFYSPAVCFGSPSIPPTSLELYSSAVIRVLIGALFFAGARTARVPWLLRALGAIAIVAGAATLFIGLERAAAIADWTAHQRVAVIRLLGFLPLVLGALIVYACGPVRRAV